MYTVNQLAKLAGVSPRTLRYYDKIGMLKPSSYGENGYRFYAADALPQLQQILFFRELDFSLEDIREIVSRPDFDRLQALETHRMALSERKRQIDVLIHTIDQTILHLRGKLEMSEKQYFEGFSEEKQKEYEKQIRARYGEHAMDGVRDWNSYTPAQKASIQAESEAIYHDLVANMAQGEASPAVQACIARWHQHLRYFYEPSVERLRDSCVAPSIV
jgi:DNA-binding transcriptional MerR regulator